MQWDPDTQRDSCCNVDQTVTVAVNEKVQQFVSDHLLSLP